VITLRRKYNRDSAIAIVIMSPLACYLLAPSLKASGHRGLWIYSMVAGTIAVLTIAVGFLIPTGHIDFLGIFERYFAFERPGMGRDNLHPPYLDRL